MQVRRASNLNQWLLGKKWGFISFKRLWKAGSLSVA